MKWPFGPVRKATERLWAVSPVQIDAEEEAGLEFGLNSKEKLKVWGEQMLSWSKSEEFCWWNDVTLDSALSAPLNNSRLWSWKSSGGDLRSRGLLLSFPQCYFWVLLRNSKPIQIIPAPNVTYLVYLASYCQDYAAITAPSRPIFWTQTQFHKALRACSSSL